MNKTSVIDVIDTLQQFRIILAAVRHHFHDLETVCGISGAQMWMLWVIAQTPGITVSRLSDALSVHVSTASSLLHKLTRAGLVESLRNTADRRVVNLRLTAQGRALLARAPGPATGLIPQALASLPPDLLARLHEDLAILIRHMDRVDDGDAARPPSTLVP